VDSAPSPWQASLRTKLKHFVAEKPLVLLANHGLNRAHERRPAFLRKRRTLSRNLAHHPRFQGKGTE
jgi:hypothetical protein